MVLNRLWLVCLVFAASIPGPSIADSRHRRAHPTEFYARAPEGVDVDLVDVAQKERHHGDCFRSLTPTEVTRGIRHWTGNC